jgi:tetratricopeptide (TPR) repeat protein
MKQIRIVPIAIGIMLFSASVFAQTNADLKKHYEAYYKQMKKQGDMQGIISAMTHLEVLEPSVARKDTLAYLYLSEGQYMQALNTIGVEKTATDSDMNVEVKALALKNLNQPKMALEHYEILYKRNPNVYLAYEMADMKIQTGDLVGAKLNIDYAMTNVTDDMKRAFYEKQQPYETSMKAALAYLKGLLTFSENKTTNIDAALKFMNDALAIDPNFNLAKVSRQALESQKAQLAQQAQQKAAAQKN